MTIGNINQNNNDFTPIPNNKLNSNDSDNYTFLLEVSQTELPTSVEVHEELDSSDSIPGFSDDTLDRLQQVKENNLPTENLDISSDFANFTEKSHLDLNRLATKYITKLVNGPITKQEIVEIRKQITKIESNDMKSSKNLAGEVLNLLTKHMNPKEVNSQTLSIQDRKITHQKELKKPSQGYLSNLAKNIPLLISHRNSQQKTRRKYSIRKSDVPALEASSKVAAKTISSQFSTLFPKERVLETAVEVVEPDNGRSWVRVLDPERCAVLKNSFNHRIEGLFQSYKFCLDNKKLSDREVLNLAKETSSAWTSLVTDKKTHKIYWSCNDAKKHLWQLKQESENECLVRGLDPHMTDKPLDSDDNFEAFTNAA